MFTRITQRAYRNFITTQDKNYNWGTPKMTRLSKKNWQEKNRVILNKKNLAEKKETNKSNEDCFSNFPVDLNTTNNWKEISNRDIFLL